MASVEPLHAGVFRRQLRRRATSVTTFGPATAGSGAGRSRPLGSEQPEPVCCRARRAGRSRRITVRRLRRTADVPDVVPPVAECESNGSASPHATKAKRRRNLKRAMALVLVVVITFVSLGGLHLASSRERALAAEAETRAALITSDTNDRSALVAQATRAAAGTSGRPGSYAGPHVDLRDAPPPGPAPPDPAPCASTAAGGRPGASSPLRAPADLPRRGLRGPEVEGRCILETCPTLSPTNRARS